MSELIVKAAFDQSVIETLPLSDEKEAMAAMDRAHRLLSDKSQWLEPYERIQILEKAADLIAAQRESLAIQAAREGGKPLIDSLVEIDRGIDGIKVAIKELHHLGGKEIPMGLTKSSSHRMAFTRRVPRGVVVAISAFNHPFNLIVHQAVPAFAVGCPVIVKPAATTPLSCRSLIEILYEAGLPKEWCQMINCENTVAEKLVTDSRNAFMTFIGSAKVGWYLRSQLPPGATCVLEHGGAAPVIVDQSAELESVIPPLTKGAFYHAGQVCVSAQRIFVHKAIYSEFADRFVESASALKVGDPVKEETEVGPLILTREVDRVHEWVQKSGGTTLCGGKKLSETCYSPTIISEPDKDANVSRKEIFGPVACIYSYDSLEEAIGRANDSEFAFQASIFTKDLGNALRATDDLQALAVMVNDHTAFRVDWMPFGGYKQSGLGVGGIGYTMRDMTIEKMFVVNKA